MTPDKLLRLLKRIAGAVILGGVVLTLFFTGAWRELLQPEGLAMAGLVCLPFSIFFAALMLGECELSHSCVLGGVALALLIGLRDYHEAFWTDAHSDVNGIVLFVAPIKQGLIAIVCLGVAAWSRWLR